ncbi:hypothetical protein E8E14_000256 [Neopestalotiopsis sp. 37M]|nr:hypothetical protein E8E14_000256 [Neopestalotiopsis sp. 37M]
MVAPMNAANIQLSVLEDIAFGIFSTSSSTVAATSGTIREYEFNITRGFISPDGFNKSALLINGQFPGPLIEANYGDTFKITVNNHLADPEEGTAFHWHGILQTNTPWYDGVASVTQCPIAPGESMTYTFLADRYGSSFYHAHFSSQYIDGLFGPLIVHGPSSAPFDIDLGPVLLTDYFHDTYYQNLALIETKPAILPYSDNNLINGKNYNNCSSLEGSECPSSSQPEIFRFETGKVHKLRLINAGAEALQRFSIDNHTLKVIANDFVPIIPYETEVITLGVGQRIDVLVEATGSPSDAVWMRSDISTVCAASNQPHALAVIHYPEAVPFLVPSTNGYTINDTTCLNDPIEWSVPWTPQKAPSTDSSTLMVTTIGVNSTGSTLFFVNNSSFKGDYNSPILLDIANSSRADDYLASPPEQYNIYNYGNDDAIRMIISNPSQASHPMHMHGHEFFILAEGVGTWNGTITNPENPTRKDTHMLAGGTVDAPAFFVAEIIADNPGVWAFHCHIAW